MIRPELLQFLTSVKTDETDHLVGSLYEHLVGTHRVLEEWNESEDLKNAGLFHSVYGTQLFDVQSATYEQRAEVQKRIGFYAERIAYLFSVIDRGTLFNQLAMPKARVYDRVRYQLEPVTEQELCDLIVLEIANFVEFSPRFQLRPATVETFSARFEEAFPRINRPVMVEATRRALNDQRQRARATAAVA